MAQNPVINKFGRAAGGGQPDAERRPTCRACTTSPRTPARARARGYMTLDDVVQRTAAMLGTVLVAGARRLGRAAGPALRAGADHRR